VKKIWLAILLVASLPSFAADAPPSVASIRELLAVTDAKKLLDGMYGQMDGILEQAMKQAIDGKSVNAEQEKIMSEFRARVVELARAEMGWDKLEPTYVDLYAKTFSQAEIDGMLAFYKSDAGKAVLAKLPLMMQNLMQMMMERMKGFMPRLQQLQEEYIPKIKAAG
jgi:uncharacterized protein